jgi:phospholipid/cholesterol/gamma-HCH transport system ATP-binding protein
MSLALADDQRGGTLIRVCDVWKSYEDEPVLRGISLEVPTAKTTVILGRSGVGKSVLLRQIAGLEIPDSGAIEIDGIDLVALHGKARQTCMRRMGMLFQSSALFDSMSIEENVAFSLLHHRRSATLQQAEVREAVDQALASVDLDGFQKKFPAELSGGQKRRAALARLIVSSPEILLFDEPTAGLDPMTSSHIASLICETQQRLHATTIVVTHDIVCALTVGHHFALHHEGRIAVSGVRDDFFASQDPVLHEFFMSALVPAHYAQIIQQG